MARLGIFGIGISCLLFAVAAQAQVSQKPLPGQDLNNIWTGTNTLLGLVQCKNFENVQCVDSTFPHGGSDIGDEINKAYAALPANGGEIDVYPNAAGTCYNFTTPILLNTSGKYVLLQGRGAGNANVAGTCLNYTITTSPPNSIAMTLDYVPAAGGGFVTAHGVSDLLLINNSFVTSGGPGAGSSATGIQIGTTNSGTQNGVFNNLKVEGFSTGINLINNGTAVPWGVNFVNLALVSNTVGMNFASSGIESTTLTNPKIAFNATGISGTMASSLLQIWGGSIDSNTVMGVTTSGAGVINVNGTWWENQGNTTTHYMNTSASVNIAGGQALDDDNNAGHTTDYWFKLSGAFSNTRDMLLFSAGRVATTVIDNTSNNSCANADFILSGSSFTSVSTGTACTTNNLWTVNQFSLFPRILGVGPIPTANFATTAAPLQVFGTSDTTALIGGIFSSAVTGRGIFQQFTDGTYNTGWGTEGATGDLVMFDGKFQGTAGTERFRIKRATGFISTAGGVTAQATQTIASGTSAMTTALIAAGACGTTVTTAATNTLTTDAITIAHNAAVTNTNGGILILNYWPTGGNVNFNYCNPTAASVTPTAMTVNWSVRRP